MVDVPVACVDLPIFSMHQTHYGNDTVQIILGADSAHLFPEERDQHRLWAPHAPKYPGLRWTTSRLTKKGILMGWTMQDNPLEQFRDLYGTKDEEGRRHLETMEDHLRIQKNRVRRALQQSLTFLNKQWRYNSQVTNLLKLRETPNYDILASIVDEAAFVTNKDGWEKTTLRWALHILNETTPTCLKTSCISKMLSYVENKVYHAHDKEER